MSSSPRGLLFPKTSEARVEHSRASSAWWTVSAPALWTRLAFSVNVFIDAMFNFETVGIVATDCRFACSLTVSLTGNP